MSSNLCMLFISDIEWAILKMVHMAAKYLSAVTLKSFPDTLRQMGRKYLKCILKYLCYHKYNEINMCNSNIQKHVCNEKWFK